MEFIIKGFHSGQNFSGSCSAPVDETKELLNELAWDLFGGVQETYDSFDLSEATL